jgi:hypothetical protein
MVFPQIVKVAARSFPLSKCQNFTTKENAGIHESTASWKTKALAHNPE